MNEVENTARILKDQQPLITSMWCYIGLHNWERWSEPYQPNKNSDKYIQTSRCACCGKYRVEKVYPHMKHL